MLPAVVIGAGAAGLAVAAGLRRRGVRPVWLERRDHAGGAWRYHYDRLHLHTDRDHSGLPGLPMPADYPRYPSRDQVVAYLADYAARIDVQPLLGRAVESVRREGEGWTVRAGGERWHARHVVVATGTTRVPVEPVLSGRESYRGQVLHSSLYRNGDSWKGRRVLVIGFGNSGGEIVVDLHESGARPAMAVRSPVNVLPKELMGVPILSWSIALRTLPAPLADAIAAPLLRMAVGDLAKTGLRRLPYGPQVQVRRHGRIPLIDVGTVRLLRAGVVKVHPAPTCFHPGGVGFDDGTQADFDAVVFATGYRPGLADFLEVDGVVDDAGAPLRHGASVVPGLHLCGFYVSPTGMLREIGREAERIAAAIAG